MVNILSSWGAQHEDAAAAKFSDHPSPFISLTLSGVLTLPHYYYSPYLARHSSAYGFHTPAHHHSSAYGFHTRGSSSLISLSDLPTLIVINLTHLIINLSQTSSALCTSLSLITTLWHSLSFSLLKVSHFD